MKYKKQLDLSEFCLLHPFYVKTRFQFNDEYLNILYTSNVLSKLLLYFDLNEIVSLFRLQILEGEYISFGFRLKYTDKIRMMKIKK